MAERSRCATWPSYGNRKVRAGYDPYSGRGQSRASLCRWTIMREDGRGVAAQSVLRNASWYVSPPPFQRMN